jgi:hypothetical protein
MRTEELGHLKFPMTLPGIEPGNFSCKVAYVKKFCNFAASNGWHTSFEFRRSHFQIFTPGSLVDIICYPSCPSSQMRIYYLNQATTTSFHILPYPLITCVFSMWVFLFSIHSLRTPLFDNLYIQINILTTSYIILYILPAFSQTCNFP